ncbi:beta-galactosidase BglY [Lachnospiraceae bacterium]|nr:beta-galactosidase BglY [Lachnospiraceae bacterium]
MEFGKMLHGGDYNPEQWLDRPDILDEDIRLMKQAHINCVTLGVFSWSVLERQEGEFCFDWLEEMIDRLYREGICTILATPTGGMPHWLTEKYPEVRQVQAEGRQNLPGKRHNFCYTSPKMRELTGRIDRRLAQMSLRHEGIVMWHISNEMGGNFSDSACHCGQCQRAFREWLKEKYKTIEELNRAWWTVFWSHVYTDWEQIHSPVPHGENLVHGLNLDWRRFVTCQMTEFLKWEITSVREYSSLPVTTNFMYFFKPLDYDKMQRELDVVSWDSYPFWHKVKDETDMAVKAAACHSMMRSMKKKPFMLMESTPSVVNWRVNNPVKRPGMHMLSSMQAVAHGSATVQYFQWRKGRGSFEKFHGAVLDHKNGGNTRTFRDVADMGGRLAKMEGRILKTCNRPEIALIFDWENWWAVEDAAGPRLDLDYKKTFLQHYRAFWEAGLDVDIISMERELESYRMVAAPLNYLYRKGYAERVERYVKEGGIYITTYWSGIVDDNDLCFTGEHPLEKVLGICQEEIDAPGEGFVNSITFREKLYQTGDLCEIIHCEDARTVSVYLKEFYAGAPAVTENRYGDGRAYYLAAEFEQDFLNDFYREMTREAGIENPLRAKLPYGVTTALRKGEEDLIFVQNFNDCKVMVKTPGRFEEADSKIILDGEVWLEPFECKILTEI